MTLPEFAALWVLVSVVVGLVVGRRLKSAAARTVSE